MTRANSFLRLLAPVKRFFLFAALCVPVFTASADITRNLVAHYALDDGTGTVARDSSGGKNDGTLGGYDSGPTGWTTGKIGGALSFDGNDDFVSVPHDNALNLKTYTVAAWVNVAPGNVIRPIVVKGKFDDGVNSTDVPYGIYLSPAMKLTLAYEKASSSQRLAENMSYEATGTGLTPGEIHHVAVTRINSGGVVAFYVDGQSRGTFESTPKPGDNKKKLYLGLDPKTNKLFKGGLDDVRIYSRALDSSEIQALFDLGSVTEQAGSGANEPPKNEESGSQTQETDDSDKNGQEETSGVTQPDDSGTSEQETPTTTTDENAPGQSSGAAPPTQTSSEPPRNEASGGESPKTGDGDKNGQEETGAAATPPDESGIFEQETPIPSTPNKTPTPRKGEEPEGQNRQSEIDKDAESRAEQLDEGDETESKDEETTKGKDTAGKNRQSEDGKDAEGRAEQLDEGDETESKDEETTKGKGTAGKNRQSEDGKDAEGRAEQLDEDDETESKDEESSNGSNSATESLTTGKSGEKIEQTPNQAPKNILLSANAVRESQKAGTVVGRLVVIDPDDPNRNGSYKLELIATATHSRRVGRIGKETNENASEPANQSAGISKSNETKKNTDKNDASAVKSSDDAAKAPSVEVGKEKGIEKAFDSTEQATTTLEKSESKQTVAKAETSAVQSSADSSKAESATKEKEREQSDDRASESKQTSPAKNNSSATANDVPFAIDGEGRLLTTRVLDYETRDSYPIRVRATDESGKSVEIDFVIQVKNAFVPIVQTVGVSKKNARRPMVTGKVLADGYSSIEEVGVVVSKQPRFAIGDKHVQVTSAEKVSQRFELSLLGLDPETTYYFRSYAANGEGTSYGALKNFTTAKSDDGPWANSESVGNGWLRSNWLGHVYQAENDWIYHQELGWLYPEKSPSTGVWLYSRDFLGWFWTGPDIFPFVYVDRSSSWAYYQGILADHRAFFHFGRSSWMTFPMFGSTKEKDSKTAAAAKSAAKQSTGKESAARQASEGKVLETTAKQKR